MEYQYPITILTPSYNREKYLPVLYKSLCAQSIQNFQWLIIDDGSTDDTENIVLNFSNHQFLLEYYKKENGGKHTALNYSHPYIKGEYICIVDSDDWLVDNAIEIIVEKQKKYESYDNVKMLTFLKGKNETTPLCNNFPNSPTVSNHIDFRVNAQRKNDCCEVIQSDVFKEFPFPIFKGEKFLGEGYLWNHAGYKYDTVYINELIYMCDYLDGGLSKEGRRLRISCPYGGMANCNSFFINDSNRCVSKKIIIKEVWLFICYGKFAGLKYREIKNKCLRQDLIYKNYLFGYMLYLFWRCKYM